ncbi:MAG: alanyl-tRNA editing protein [Peptostreptococcaceae bacterium]|nr:alanyl-tRNA editing protein [Peptostreptococcaceae bacterium]MDY5738777.1 alanyl-tRNA editing protein [Anaerovoracaceae bacterium]
MKTIRLYQKDVYLKSCTANIVSTSEYWGKKIVVLDKTIFFPTGGGQSCDLGTISIDNQYWDVVDVYEYNDEICHVVEPHIPVDGKGIDGEPIYNGIIDGEHADGGLIDSEHTDGEHADGEHADGGGANLEPGIEVTLAIDWSRRFDNMQRHCGEHIMSGMFFREYGGVNRGFHMGDDYMTIDIDLSGTGYDRVTWDMAKHVEFCTNVAIWENLPVVTTHYDTRSEAEKEPLRKALAIDKDITIVRIGSAENPSDAVACCGTHPATSGQVGMVKIYKVEPNKGMTRIYLEAGQRAFKRYQEEFDVLSSISDKLSSGTNDLLDKYAAKEDKIQQSKDKLYNMEKKLLNLESQSVIRSLTSSPSGGFTSFTYSDYDADFLQSLGKLITKTCSAAFVLIQPELLTCIMFSDGKSIDCGKIVKEQGLPLGGKGGGGKNFARITFSNLEQMNAFKNAYDHAYDQ